MKLLDKIFFSKKQKIFLEHKGFCNTCDSQVTFNAMNSWLRDHFLCSNCGSIPRERALMYAIETYYPNFRDLRIHESSPGGRGASLKLLDQCSKYTASHFDTSVPLGSIASSGYRSEDLQNLTFEDESFDLVVTQDVIEHLFEPEKAFTEINRILRPGGAHIFTVPLVNKIKKTERCATMDDGQVRYLMEPEYHGNPIDSSGSLVTMRWGYDICEWIYRSSSLCTVIFSVDNLDLGIRAEYCEVLISVKAC